MPSPKKIPIPSVKSVSSVDKPPVVKSPVDTDAYYTNAIINLTGGTPMSYRVRPNGDVSVVTWKGQKFLLEADKIKGAS
jgi:hypothetical protein